MAAVDLVGNQIVVRVQHQLVCVQRVCYLLLYEWHEL